MDKSIRSKGKTLKGHTTGSKRRKVVLSNHKIRDGPSNGNSVDISFKLKNQIPTGFRLSGGAKELHKHPIYCVAWSTDSYVAASEDVSEEDMSSDYRDGSATPPLSSDALMYQCFATCAGPFVTIYEVGNGGKGAPKVRQAYRDVDPEESFYSCAFGGRGVSSDLLFSIPKQEALSDYYVTLANPSRWSSSLSNNDSDGKGAQLICCAGKRGIVKIIDPLRKQLVMTLSGHGDDIYDLKFSPLDEFLLITASKDESLRLWNIRSATCVAIFAGHEGHRDSVLSLSFHPLGTTFVSAGMDTSVKIWSLEEAALVEAIQDSNSRNTISSSTAKPFFTRYQQMPLFSTNKVHTDYIDCVQYVGDLILSKSITNTIVLWKPDTSHFRRSRQTTINDDSASKYITSRPPRSGNVFPLREFQLSNCQVWFIRFHTDADCRLLAIGNTVGKVKVWKIGCDDGTGDRKSVV